MRNYAVHRIYISGTRYIPQASISINEKGEVVSYQPLVNETAATEWIGGILVLSNKVEIKVTNDFQTLLNDLTPLSHASVYAWHVSNFNFQTDNLTSESQIKRLH